MPEVLEWPRAARPHEVVGRAVRALVEGQLVALPTETVYGLAASALVPAAVERLQQSKGRPIEKPLTVALRVPGDALDWVPAMSPLGQRLARRCWPGPVTLVFRESVDQGLASRLPEAVRQRVCPTGTLGLRVPAHAALAPFWAIRAIRSLRSELEFVDEGLKRLMICEIGNPSGAFSALKFRMIAMPSSMSSKVDRARCSSSCFESEPMRARC